MPQARVTVVGTEMVAGQTSFPGFPNVSTLTVPPQADALVLLVQGPYMLGARVTFGTMRLRILGEMSDGNTRSVLVMDVIRPPAGRRNVVLYYGGGGVALKFVAVYLRGVAQRRATAQVKVTSVYGANRSISVNGVPLGLVVDMLSVDSTSAANTPAAGQQVIYSLDNANASYKHSKGGPTTMAWTNPAGFSAHAVVSVRPASTMLKPILPPVRTLRPQWDVANTNWSAS